MATTEPKAPAAPSAAPASPPPAFLITQPTAQQRSYIKALIYGPYGVGKTTLAASASEVESMKRVMYIDAESGQMSLVGMDLDVVRINKYSQLARVYEFLRLHCRYRDASDMDGLKKLQERFRGPMAKDEVPIQYYTVVVDSLTEVQKYVMYQLLSVDISGASLDIVPDSAEFKEWGQSAEMVRLMIRAFRDLPMNVIFVLPEMESDDAGRQIFRPSLPGKLSGEAQGFFDVVGYLRSTATEEGIKRRLYLRDGATFKAKHRFRGVEAAYLDDPTMARLLDLQKQAQS